MMIRVVGSVDFGRYNYQPPEPQIKYYHPQETKEKVKEDFGIVLDREMKKLHFNEVV